MKSASKRMSSSITKEPYMPAKALVNYMIEKLHHDIETDTLPKLDPAQQERTRNLDRRKVHILHKIIFPSMANLVFFLESVNGNKRLQELFEDDIKDLIGMRQSGDYDKLYTWSTFSRLIRAVLLDRYHDDTNEESAGDDYKMVLADILQQYVNEKLMFSLRKQFGENEIVDIMADDINRVRALTKLSASKAPREKGGTGRKFTINYLEVKEDHEGKKVVKLFDEVGNEVSINHHPHSRK
jgi:hypothetical protein